MSGNFPIFPVVSLSSLVSILLYCYIKYTIIILYMKTRLNLFWNEIIHMCTALIAKKSHGKGSILHTSLLRTLMLKLEDLLIPYTYLYSVYTYIYILQRCLHTYLVSRPWHKVILHLFFFFLLLFLTIFCLK